MIFTVAAVAAPVCVGVIATYLGQQKALSKNDDAKLLAHSADSKFNENNMIKLNQVKSILPSPSGYWAALRSMFSPRPTPGSEMRVVDSVALSPRDRLYVVEVGDCWLVVGQGAGGLSSLGMLRKGGLPLSDSLPRPPVITDSSGEEGVMSLVNRAKMKLGGEPDSVASSMPQLQEKAEPAGVMSSVAQGLMASTEKPEQPPVEAVAVVVESRLEDAPHEASEGVIPEGVAFASAPEVTPAVVLEAVAEASESDVQRGVEEVRQMLAVASAGPAATGEVSRDDSGFPDVIEAVRVTSSVEAVSGDASSVGSVSNSAAKKSFLDLYAEVRKNSDA